MLTKIVQKVKKKGKKNRKNIIYDNQNAKPEQAIAITLKVTSATKQ